VILEEMNMYFDTPRDYIGALYEDLMFGDNPLGWETLGTRETIKAATRDTFLDYVGTWYRPDRLVVGVAGNLGAGLPETVERLLGDLDGRADGTPPAADVPNGAAPRVSVHHKASDQAHICIGVPTYPIEHPDRYALQLLATVLGSGMSSRLFTEVRERRGLAYYVYAINHSYTDAGSLYAQAGVDISRIDDAVTTIARELTRIADEPVGADELEKARGLAKGRFVLQTESPQGLLLFGLRREVLEGRAHEPTEVLAGLDAVTAHDIQRVAQDVIAGGGLRLALIGPFEDSDRFAALLSA
jgi:predicted Zn-dependent peptidase